MLPPSRPIKLFFYRADVHFSSREFLEYRSPLGRSFLPDPPVPMLAERDKTLFVAADSLKNADFIVFPYVLSDFIYRCGLYGDRADWPRDPRGNERILELFHSLPYYREAEERHVFVTEHDWSGPFGTRSVILARSPSTENPATVVSDPDFIDDLLPECSEARIPQVIRYHTNFVGSVATHPLRRTLVQSLTAHANGTSCLNVHLDTVRYFHGRIIDEELKKERRRKYLEAMARSYTTLCPRGTGVQSVRMYETMSMGRIPVLISDQYRLPMPDEIDWDGLVIRVKEQDTPAIGEVLEEWFSSRGRTTLMRMCLANRMVWEKYFSPGKRLSYIASSLYKVLEDQGRA